MFTNPKSAVPYAQKAGPSLDDETVVQVLEWKPGLDFRTWFPKSRIVTPGVQERREAIKGKESHDYRGTSREAREEVGQGRAP